MSGPRRANASRLTVLLPGASAFTSVARRPLNALSPTPSNSMAIVTHASAACSPSPASACSPPQPRISRKSPSPWHLGQPWPEPALKPSQSIPKTKKPPKNRRVCQRSAGRPKGRPVFIRSLHSLLAGRLARRSFGLLPGLQVFAGRLVDRLHRQTRFAAIVETKQLDLDLVAFLDDVGGLLHAVGCELADVDQPVL